MTHAPRTVGHGARGRRERMRLPRQDRDVPLGWAIAGPSATWRTVHPLGVHRTASVFAPPSVATNRSPGRAPAENSAAELTCSTTSSPGWAFPGVPRSATSAVNRPRAGRNASLSTPVSPPWGNPERATSALRPFGAIA